MYENDDLRKIQLLETRILLEIDKICKSNNICYYLIAGSLLGAIRYKGFIPWDDDIDIVMLREDYEKFRSIRSELPSFLLFQDMFSCDDHVRICSKVILKDCKFESEGDQNLNCAKGFFVDIFPVDRIKKPDGFLTYLRSRIGSFYANTRLINIGVSKAPNLYWKMLSIISRILGVKLMKKLLYSALTFDRNTRTDLTTNFGSGYGYKKQTFDISVYGRPRYVEFEGHLFPAPEKYEFYLERIYGKNYIQPPPENKRINRHRVLEYDFKNVEYLIQ